MTVTARAYTDADFATVNDWAEARGVTLIPGLLSPNGFIAEDEHGPCGVLWVYLLFDVPVAMIDNQFTRPGLAGRRALRSWQCLWRCVQDFLRGLHNPQGQPLQYRIVRAFALPGMLPQARREGWHISDQVHHQTLYLL